MKQILIIPNFRIRSLWEISTKNVFKNNRIKKADMEVIAYYSKDLIKADCKRRVTIRCTIPKGARRLDDDNCWKIMLDALVKCGMLVNDSPKWVQRNGEVEWVRIPLEDHWEVEVILEDVKK